jgi:nucleotide-binding universal stress UspA family protein
VTDALTGAPVVVGVDGSEESRAAIGLAVRMAAERHRPLRVVHAYTWPWIDLPITPMPGPPVPVDSSPGSLTEGLRDQAERVVTEAARYARQCDPLVAVSADAIVGGPAQMLTAESRHAALIVIGSRGRGGFAGLLLGSVAVQVAAHACGPVVVARGSDRTTGPVVVGVDGSATSAQAIGFAAQEAELRGAALRAVYAWTPPVSTGPGDVMPLVYDVESAAAGETRVLTESIAGLADDHPDLRVESKIVHMPAAEALIEQSRSAQLVAVGSRGRGGFMGLLLGSVSQALIHHAECPVAVIRPASASATQRRGGSEAERLPPVG